MSLKKFPARSLLKDGSPCSVRPMEAGDEQAFRDFHTVIPEQEQLFVRNQIKDGSLFKLWMNDPEFSEHLPLLAFVDGRLAGLGTLHQRPGGWKRHIGEVYFLTHPNFRGMGVLDLLLEEIIALSRHRALTKLESSVNGERKSAIDSMVSAGFCELVRLPNYILDMQAQPHDYVLLGMELVAPFENLGAGD